MKNLKKFSILAFAAIFFFAACKKDDDAAPMQNNPGGEPQAQSFTVKMTDAPGDFEALNVTITGVDAYIEGQGWVSLDNSNNTSVDVLTLTNGNETTIASSANAQAGVYTKLRVAFDQDAKLTLNSEALVGFGGIILAGNRVQLTWMSSTSNEVIIDINEYVSADVGAEVLLDFDVASSIERDADRYLINPSMRVINDARTGVKGEVEGSANAAIMLTDGQNSYSTFIDAQGRFMIRGVRSGTYTMIIDAASQAAANNQADKEISGVVIVEGEIKQMGQITL